MSVGMGIFLGCVFLGTVILYLKTAASWNWRKIGKRTLLTIGVLVAGIVLVALGFAGYAKWEDRPQVVTSLDGIAVGEKLSDVIFKHGSFEKEEKDPDSVKKYQDEERYEQKDKGVSIIVHGGVVESVHHHCQKESDYTSVNGVSCNDSGDKIKELFDKKIRILCEKRESKISQFVRVYDVAEYGTRYYVALNKVRGFFIIEKGELETLVGFNWEKCK